MSVKKDNSTNLLHKGDNKKADKWIDDIKCTVMVVNATCLCRPTLKPSKWGQPTTAPIFAHLAPCHIFGANKVNIIFNDGSYFINKVTLKCRPKLLL